MIVMKSTGGVIFAGSESGESSFSGFRLALAAKSLAGMTARCTFRNPFHHPDSRTGIRLDIVGEWRNMLRAARASQRLNPNLKDHFKESDERDTGIHRRRQG